MSWISRTPSERSLTREDIGGYPLDSSFVFNLQRSVLIEYQELTMEFENYHLQNVLSWTSRERVSRDSIKRGELKGRLSVMVAVSRS